RAVSGVGRPTDGVVDARPRVAGRLRRCGQPDQARRERSRQWSWGPIGQRGAGAVQATPRRQRAAARRITFDADIRSCFDRINHAWLLANIPMDKAILRKWLAAGFVEDKV